MADRVLLTEQRETVLNGEYEGSDVALRNQKSRLRKSSQTALEELVEVARSPEIDNQEVFDPDTVFQLLRALLLPRKEDYLEGQFGGLSHPDDYTDDFRAYSDRLTTQMAKLILTDDYDTDD